MYTEYSKVPGSASKPVGYWTAKNMRSVLENYAVSRNMNPSSPETWNSISYTDIHELEVLNL